MTDIPNTVTPSVTPDPEQGLTTGYSSATNPKRHTCNYDVV
jgi:hypothetical protein